MDSASKGTVSTYQMRPKLSERFQVNTIREVIHSCLSETLLGQTYDAEKVPTWTEGLSELIKSRVLGLGLPQYKVVVQIVLGEQRGEGVRVSSRCLWDADTDNQASQTFINDTIFCMAVVFGVFIY